MGRDGARRDRDWCWNLDRGEGRAEAGALIGRPGIVRNKRSKAVKGTV